MKIIFIKVQDPMEWREPTRVYHQEDLHYLSLISVERIAGILLNETESILTLGSLEIAVDNPERATKYGIKFPAFRYVLTVLKSNIIERQDFEVKETTK